MHMLMLSALAEQPQYMSARDRAQALWGIPPEIYGEGIPFKELPYERDVSSSPDLETAYHELNHLRAMQLLGEDRNVLWVTVRRRGNVLGAVMHSGVSPHNADIISAAGGVETRLGPASGTGGDQLSVYVRNMDNPVAAWNANVARARSLIGPPTEYTDKVASGLVVLGDAPKPLLNLLERRVAYELKVEAAIGKDKAAEFFANGGVAPPYKSEPDEETNSVLDYPIPQKGTVTLTEFLEDGGRVDSEYVDGILVCSKCQGKSYHDMDCPILVEAKQSESTLGHEYEPVRDQKETVDVVPVGSEMVTLFTYKERKNTYLRIVK